MHNGMQKGGRSWTVVDVTRERSINDSRRFEGYRTRIEASFFFFFFFLRNTARWWNIGARKREREWTRSERWFYDYKKRTYEALPVNVSSLRSLIPGKKVQQLEWRDLNYGNIVSLSVLRDVMVKYKYSGECEENLYDRA